MEEAPAIGFKRSMKKWVTRAVLVLVFGPIIGAAAWTWGSLKFVYAKGERAGFIQKFSKKGWLCKTWEGELAMANLPGTMPEIFSFTVRNPKVAEDIVKNMGHRVAIDYDQHRGVPTTCFGETMHYVTSVRPVGPAESSTPDSK